MVSASTRTTAADPLASLTYRSSNSSSTTNSFAQQLASAIQGYIKQSLNGSNVGIKVSEVAGQNSGGSQFLVTVTPVGEMTTTAAGAKAAMPEASGIPTMLGMGPVAGTAPVKSNESSEPVPTMLGMGPASGTAPVVSTAPSTTPAVTTKSTVAQATTPVPVDVPTETETDAYWAAQPAAVQALRGMPDDDAKEKLALSLANQGYSIDTQIMVWNWDPQMTMQVRENQGYSWVPSFGQSNIPIGPGLSMPGNPNSYSPNSPPPGSIPVSTAFAVGTIQNPLVQVDPVTT